MPITPFHLGPGAALKAMLGRRMSFTVFALANGLIDLEPIANFVLTGDPAHRFFHTLIGATIVVLVSVWPGRLLCERVLRWWNSRLSPAQARYLAVAPAIEVGAAITGAAGSPAPPARLPHCGRRTSLGRPTRRHHRDSS
jgi:hypothetical protein